MKRNDRPTASGPFDLSTALTRREAAVRVTALAGTAFGVTACARPSDGAPPPAPRADPPMAPVLPAAPAPENVAPTPKESPMITLRPAAARGHADHGWLDSHHTFSFANYHDPNHMGFRALRVINEDRVAPGRGFGTHPHRDMEIVSYVLDGGLEHRDSMGNGSVIRPGDVQRMSAGTGVRHSEYNASKTDTVHFLQIWLLPSRLGIEPGYEQKAFTDAEKQGRLRLIASPDGRDGSVTIHTDARLYSGRFAAGESASFELNRGRHAWVQVARGQVKLGDQLLGPGDGAALSGDALAGGGRPPHPRGESLVTLTGVDSAEVLLFDLA